MHRSSGTAEVVGSTQAKPSSLARSFSRPPRSGALIQRACGCEDKDKCACAQREAAPGGEAQVEGAASGRVQNVLSSAGAPLDPGIRAAFEPRFGTSLAPVRVHTDGAAGTSARELSARAYTVGNHIAFAPGMYQPATRSGQRLIAHELAHVVQQGFTPPAMMTKLEVSRPGDAYEREADAAADRVLAGGTAHIAGGAPPSLQRGSVADCDSEMLDNTEIGEEAHTAIQSWCAAQNPPCHAEVPIKGGSRKGTGNTGFADLVVSDPPNSNVIEVGEIKPISWINNVGGYEQLLGYMEALQAANPTKTVKPMTWVPGPPNGVYPFLEPGQFLGCYPSEMGMYFYKCWKKPQGPWIPIPVPIPKEVLDQLKDRIKKFLKDLDSGGKDLVPAPAPSHAWAYALLAVCVVILAILLLPEEAVLGAIYAILRVAAALLGLTSLAWASEGGGGGGGGVAGRAGAGGDGKGGGKGGKQGSGTGGKGGTGTSAQGGSGTKGTSAGGKGAGAGSAWDPLLDALKDSDGTALTPDQVAKIKAVMPQLLAKLRKAAANDPNAKDITELLDQLDKLKDAADKGGGSGGDKPDKPKEAKGAGGGTKADAGGGKVDAKKPAKQPEDEDGAGHGAGKGKGKGKGAGKSKSKGGFGEYVPAVPAPAEAQQSGEIHYAYLGGLEGLTLANFTSKQGTTFPSVTIQATIGDTSAVSVVPFTVDHRDGDIVVLKSANQATLVVQPAGESKALFINPGSELKYKPADAPKPKKPK